MYNHKIVNANTNEETIVELSQDEILVIEANIVKRNADLAKAVTKAAARQAVLDRLGLTEEEAQLIIGGSN